MATLNPVLPAIGSAGLRRALAEGRVRARARLRPVLVSLIEPIDPVDPLVAFAAAPAGQERCYWEHQPEDGTDGMALAGIGAAQTLVAGGEGHFAEVAAQWRDLLDDARIAGADGMPGTGPLLFGGARFDPLRPRSPLWQAFPDALLTLPRFTIASTAGTCWLTTNLLVGPVDDVETLAEETWQARSAMLGRAARAEGTLDATPNAGPLEDMFPAAQWQQAVERTAAEIREGRFAKVVLARAAHVQPAGDATGFDPAHTLALLRARYPHSFLFAMARPAGMGEEHVFLGATPERLIRLRERTVETTCLAGSIRRGLSEQEDRRLGGMLLASAKDREEHAVVATMLREALDPLCQNLDIPATPTLLHLPTVQHLYTPVRGTLREESTVLDLVERLHPTPAVGGFPRVEALAAIREREALDRGWYAGPIGWLDARGEGEFAVAIRSALLNERGATLFAGCGIMGDSDPVAEYAESALKMQAVHGALSR